MNHSTNSTEQMGFFPLDDKHYLSSMASVQWRVSEAASPTHDRTLIFDNGAVIVNTTGDYFIYSQVTLYNKRHTSGHDSYIIEINGKEWVKCRVSYNVRIVRSFHLK